MFIRIFCVAACYVTPKQQGQAMAQAFSHRPLTTGSIPGHSMWNLWWTKCWWVGFFSEYFGFTLAALFH